MYGGGEFPLLYTKFAANGNYLEPEGIAVRHGVCGDPEQVRGTLSVSVIYVSVMSWLCSSDVIPLCGRSFRFRV